MPLEVREHGYQSPQQRRVGVIQHGYDNYISDYNHPNSNQQRQPMTQQQDYRHKYIVLQSANEILNAELEQSRQRELTLKRQLSILSELQNQTPLRDYTEELDAMRQELISCLHQKDQLGLMNKSYREKIQDLKYHNGQLKMLNEKVGQLHQREICMMRKQAIGVEDVEEAEERARSAIRERDRVQKQLQEVARVAGQMQHYYMQQIRSKNDIISQQQQQINRLADQLQGGRTERYKQSQLISQYQTQITELKAKVKFLINKIQHNYHEETISKPSLGALSSISSQMVQSKMVQSNSSLDSFRLAPSSFPAKENLTRRNTSGAKTPSKYSMTHRHSKPVMQERNY